MGVVMRAQPCSSAAMFGSVGHFTCDSDCWRDYAHGNVVGKYDNLSTQGQRFGEFPKGILFVLAVQVKNQYVRKNQKILDYKFTNLMVCSRYRCMLQK